MEEEHEGASVKELLIEACRRNNTDLLTELLQGRSDEDISTLLNTTTTVMGNHLFHEAALHGNYEIIDLLLDQPEFECDPVNRVEGDTPLHSIIRWINLEPVPQRPFANALIEMMLEAGCSTRVRNKARLTPFQLVDPGNQELRDLIQRFEWANQNAGDFVNVDEPAAANAPDPSAGDAEFSGSDSDEIEEWQRRKRDGG